MRREAIKLVKQLIFSSLGFVLIMLDLGVENGKTNGKGNSGKEKRGACSFTFRELATATKNFREVNLIGEGGFGKVYKGRLESGQASCFNFITFVQGYYVLFSDYIRIFVRMLSLLLCVKQIL